MLGGRSDRLSLCLCGSFYCMLTRCHLAHERRFWLSICVLDVVQCDTRLSQLSLCLKAIYGMFYPEAGSERRPNL